MDADVKDAVLELAGFYGMSLGDDYIKAIIGGKTATEAIKSAADSAEANPASVFNEDKKKFKSIKSACEAIKDIADVQKKITITPDGDGDAADVPDVLRNKYGSPGRNFF